MDSMLVDLAGEHPPLINAFSCMKAGLKNCDANGNAGPIRERVKKLVDDYNEALQEKYPETGKSNLLMASGTRPATSRAFQTLLARYEESVANVGRLTDQNNALVQQNAALTRDVKRNGRVLELILNKVQIEIPPDLLQVEENDMGGTIDGSSRASANLDMDNSDGH
ncbi:unnamed protein product [Miscanthus lutarioriparius]|uniref:Uncharacterized protein n=1 Tax=Miscanthus lutarioriparius TaxID=422564 RepID=A0A811NMM7_9POAL|nr:unnamed protein product [Miscanthus lutarioriparius]